MDKMTITEALAELKTLGKRIAKKREFITQHLVRQEKFKDPLESDGGSRTVISRERQSIADLVKRAITIRMAIGNANAGTSVTINGETRSIAEWLVWRRDIAPGERDFLSNLQGGIAKVRDEAMRKGLTVTSGGETVRPDDVIVNTDELRLAEEAENLDAILGALDGQLSLKNATVSVEV